MPRTRRVTACAWLGAATSALLVAAPAPALAPHARTAARAATAPAIGTSCQTSGPASGTYAITVCLDAPPVLTGPASVSATVTGGGPAIKGLDFRLNGAHVLADVAPPYAFVLPSQRFVDGSRILSVEPQMSDGFISSPASAPVAFANGVTTPPQNPGSFVPRTGRPPAAGEPFVVAAAGDGAGGLDAEGQVTGLIGSWNPNLVLYLGDVYNSGTPTEFYNWYGHDGSLYDAFRPITDPTPGNHEYGAVNAAGYFDYWDNPPHYYSVDAGGWHIISLDSNAKFGQTAPGSAQYQWLANDLAADGSRCTLAFWHHPVLSVGGEGPAPAMDDIWALLARHGADVVLNGDEHNYQRWAPLDGALSPDPLGMTEFIVGTGGHTLFGFATSDARLAQGVTGAFGALRLTLTSAGADYEFVDTSGAVRDSGSVACHDPAVTAPELPPAGADPPPPPGDTTPPLEPAAASSFTRSGLPAPPAGPDPAGAGRLEVPAAGSPSRAASIARRARSRAARHRDRTRRSGCRRATSRHAIVRRGRGRSAPVCARAKPRHGRARCGTRAPGSSARTATC